ncbi:MAG: hypothetical protein HOP12_05020 [Candidatus Eisenbacteria bacterium]|uniref:ABC transporter permease n=1 Tax=Eiseniibacteriota bacterium TaxID=2212470 RepID=A0A849SKZ3_UNCEI|nr:hypothetical protein [Candidatus Eisenbacteria bacterium]
MTLTIALATARQRFTSPFRLVLLAFTFLPWHLGALLSHQFQVSSEVMLFGFILTAGVIGQEVSSGVLQLVFARPVKRWEYVIGRWLGVALPASALAIVFVLSLAGVVSLSGGALEWKSVMRALLEAPFRVFGISAVLLMFSAAVKGLGDLAVWAMVGIVGGIVGGFGGSRGWKWLARAAEELGNFLSPCLSWSGPFSGGTWPLQDAVAWCSTVAICLTIAIVLVNRKELSYGST